MFRTSVQDIILRIFMAYNNFKKWHSTRKTIQNTPLQQHTIFSNTEMLWGGFPFPFLYIFFYNTFFFNWKIRYFACEIFYPLLLHLQKFESVAETGGCWMDICCMVPRHIQHWAVQKPWTVSGMEQKNETIENCDGCYNFFSKAVRTDRRCVSMIWK